MVNGGKLITELGSDGLFMLFLGVVRGGVQENKRAGRASVRPGEGGEGLYLGCGPDGKSGMGV